MARLPPSSNGGRGRRRLGSAAISLVRTAHLWNPETADKSIRPGVLAGLGCPGCQAASCRSLASSSSPVPRMAARPDHWQGYRGRDKLDYTHDRRSQRAARALGGDPGELLPRVHRVISNLKSWLLGTHHGVSGEHLPAYLDEYVFRFNRRRTPMAAFQTLLGLSSQQAPTTYREIAATGPRALSIQRS